MFVFFKRTAKIRAVYEKAKLIIKF